MISRLSRYFPPDRRYIFCLLSFRIVRILIQAGDYKSDIAERKTLVSLQRHIISDIWKITEYWRNTLIFYSLFLINVVSTNYKFKNIDFESSFFFEMSTDLQNL